MKKIIFIILFPFLSFSQTQIGQDVYGSGVAHFFGRDLCLSSNGNVFASNGRSTNFSVFPNQINGYVSVYKILGGIWTQIGANIFSQTLDDNFGFSISLSYNGNILAIGSTYNNENGHYSGKVTIYQNLSGIWTQVGQAIQGIAANDFFGKRVSLSTNGNLIAITTGDDYSTPGYVKIYQNLSGIWTQIGQDINGELNGDLSGTGLSLSSDGTIVAIGAPYNDGNGTSSGHVRIYQNLSGIWSQIGQDINGEAAQDLSGLEISLSSDGTIIAIGAPNNDGNGTNSGHVRIYQNLSGVWTQVGQDINGEAAGDLSGTGLSLSSDGTIVAIGAPSNIGNGQVRIYQNLIGIWTQVGQDINGDAVVNSSIGQNVSLSANGHIVATASAGYSGINYRSGQVKIYDLSAILKSDNFIQSNFSLTPNPTSEILTVNLQENLVFEKAIIYAISGQIIKTETTKTFNVSDLSKGTYFLEVITDKGKATKSFIVE